MTPQYISIKKKELHFSGSLLAQRPWTLRKKQIKAALIREFAGATSLNGRKKQIKAALWKEFAGATSLNGRFEIT